MTNSINKTQTRGICQCCGNDQAVLTSGKMSKHGYTVEGGWFSGVCGGQRHLPLQKDRSVCDSTIRLVRASAAALRQKAAALESGEIDPEVIVTTRWNPETRKAIEIPFSEGSKWTQDETRKSLVWNTNRRAEIGESFANELEATADRVHGTELRVVVLEAGPAPILAGEQRFAESGHDVMTVVEVRGARVYWTMPRGTEGKVYKGWTGTQAWRRARLVETLKAA